MKQLIQSVSSGELDVLEVPAPLVLPGGVLVRTRSSIVSAGTERRMTGFAQASLIQKARSRPDLVRQTIDKAKRDGVLDTYDAVRNRLDQSMTLGYSAAGEVIEVGSEISEFRIGQRVACGGGGFAAHAQIISVPRNLVAAIPDGVTFEDAAFATLGAVALHGIRLADVKLGEVVAVIGLGLVGQLTIQMLRAAGCLVAGTDPVPSRVDLARRFGLAWAGTDNGELAARVAELTGGHGADAVVIAADTESDQPVELAGEIARNRGVVIAVGAVGTRLPRSSYFAKELEFRISRSYGPGRYDAGYEEKGHDYPYGFVRWTENRNMQAFLSMLAARTIEVPPLVTHRFDIEEGTKAYDLISGRTGEPFLGVTLQYRADPDLAKVVRLSPANPAAHVDDVRIGVIGAGAFASSTLLPVLKKTDGVQLVGIASARGVSARSAAGRYGFGFCATSAEALFGDPSINTVAILTRHNLHAEQVELAIRAGKHVFVEKPLCLTEDELDRIVAAREEMGGRTMVMVGFNRRFAPLVVALRDAVSKIREPLMLTCRVNAGFIPQEHWTQEPAQGGGRLLGEGCHFIDLLSYLAGDVAARVTTRVLPDSGRYSQDNFQVEIDFCKGSIGTVTYAANGDRSLGKESIEVFGGGLAARLDDYRLLEIHHNGRSKKMTSRLRQDKGHSAEWGAIVRHLTSGGPAPIPFDEIVSSTRATLAAHASLRSRESESLEP